MLVVTCDGPPILRDNPRPGPWSSCSPRIWPGGRPSLFSSLLRHWCAISGEPLPRHDGPALVVKISPLAPPPRPQPTLVEMLQLHGRGIVSGGVLLREERQTTYADPLYRGSLFTMVDSNTTLNYPLERSQSWRDHDSSRCHARGRNHYLSFPGSLRCHVLSLAFLTSTLTTIFA